MASHEPLLVIVTGLSGAGRSVAIKALEDLSFMCIDNLPLELLDQTINYFIKLSTLNEKNQFALGIDIRSRDFVESFDLIKSQIGARIKLDVVFLTCDEEALVRRYSSTRRKHPLLDQGGELLSAIRREATLLSPIEKLADWRIDTSAWTPHYLTRIIESRYATEVKGRALHVTVISFGFKYGVLKAADAIFDVRFLKNPYFDSKLKEKNGLHQEVQEYIESDPNTEKFLQYLEELHKFLLPNYYKEGKHYFRIGIGCTGGLHRSVYIAEKFSQVLAEMNLPNVFVSVSHRDLIER
jgi:UPF0042 nucleotide-binding protein